MTWGLPSESGYVRIPTGFAQRLAKDLEQTGEINDEVVERVRNSNHPLAETIYRKKNTAVSIGSIIRYHILSSLEDELIGVSFNERFDDQEVKMWTHSSKLANGNSLLHSAAAAKAYQYGYWLNDWRVGKPETLIHPSTMDKINEKQKVRHLNFVQTEPAKDEDVKEYDEWFSDETAVRTFAAHVCDDNVAWEQYIPWYRTTTVPAYQLEHTARDTDWTAFPDKPESKPSIKNEFGVSDNPNVGDFIRTAVIHQLERSHPDITNISIGPSPWATDELSILVEPSAKNKNHDEGILCPEVALRKLAEYGYRPIGGWYDTPVVGYDSTDSVVPRRIEFARETKLTDWDKTILSTREIHEDVNIINETAPLNGFDLEKIIPCIRSQTITYRQLHKLVPLQPY